MQNKFAQDAAYAILTENPESLAELWLSNSDTDKLGLIERGKNFCAQMGDIVIQEKWKKIYNELKLRGINQRINDINVKMRTNSATIDELQELANLQKQREIYAR